MKKKIIIIMIILFIIIMTLGTIYLYYKEPSISIPKYIGKEFDFKKETFQGKNIYVLGPKKGKSKKIILYQHGGTYAMNLTNTYWDFFADIIEETGATFIIPDYPLTPKYCYKDVFDMMLPLYQEVTKKIDVQNLIVMGDSAGGGLSLALCEKVGEEKLEQPSKLILISPWLDVSMSNSKIEEVQKNDKLLNKDLLKLAGQIYARDKETNYYLVSPINGPVEKLKNVTVFSGTYDILNPDTRLFVEKANKQGIQIDYRETEGAEHIWILSHRNENAYHANEDYNALIQIISAEN